MSFVQQLMQKLEAGLWHFVRLIHSANHDYPYHDFVKIDNLQGEGEIVGSYNVGNSNVNKQGDQHKLFTSKRANIWAYPTTASPELHFNDSKNVAILLPMDLAIDADRQFHKDFYTNISTVYYMIPAHTVLFMYFEGVLPQEARDAE